MTREAYLNELTQLLKRQNTPDIDDIVAEYDAHFTYKTADGFTEEEVADKLGSPEQIAEQYLQAQTGSRRMGRGVLKFGFGLLDFVLALLFTVLYGWVIALGAFAAASAAAGLGLMFQAGGLPAAPLFAAIPPGWRSLRSACSPPLRPCTVTCMWYNGQRRFCISRKTASAARTGPDPAFIRLSRPGAEDGCAIRRLCP